MTSSPSRAAVGRSSPVAASLSTDVLLPVGLAARTVSERTGAPFSFFIGRSGSLINHDMTPQMPLMSSARSSATRRSNHLLRRSSSMNHEGSCCSVPPACVWLSREEGFAEGAAFSGDWPVSRKHTYDLWTFRRRMLAWWLIEEIRKICRDERLDPTTVYGGMTQGR